MTKYYESENEFNSDNNIVEPTDENVYDFCERCDGYTGEDNLLNVMEYENRVERFVCESCYDNNLDWYRLIL